MISTSTNNFPGGVYDTSLKACARSGHPPTGNAVRVRLIWACISSQGRVLCMTAVSFLNEFVRVRSLELSLIGDTIL